MTRKSVYPKPGTPMHKRTPPALQKPKEMISVEKAEYSRMVRKLRDLETEHAKLVSYMKIIQEAARESQTRVRVYSKREDAPAEKRPSRSNGNGFQQRNTGQVLRGKDKVPVGGVQVPTFGSTPYQPDFPKTESKVKPAPAKVGSKSSR